MPDTTKNRAEELLDNLRAGNLWERLRTSDPAVAFADYRDEIEGRVEASVDRLLTSLQIATRADLERVEGEISSLRKKVEKLTRQVSKSRVET